MRFCLKTTTTTTTTTGGVIVVVVFLLFAAGVAFGEEVGGCLARQRCSRPTNGSWKFECLRTRVPWQTPVRVVECCFRGCTEHWLHHAKLEASSVLLRPTTVPGAVVVTECDLGRATSAIRNESSVVVATGKPCPSLDALTTTQSRLVRHMRGRFFTTFADSAALEALPLVPIPAGPRPGVEETLAAQVSVPTRSELVCCVDTERDDWVPCSVVARSADKESYAKTLASARFALCPRSKKKFFWSPCVVEALAAGAVPLLDDGGSYRRRRVYASMPVLYLRRGLTSAALRDAYASLLRRRADFDLRRLYFPYFLHQLLAPLVFDDGDATTPRLRRPLLVTAPLEDEEAEEGGTVTPSTTRRPGLPHHAKHKSVLARQAGEQPPRDKQATWVKRHRPHLSFHAGPP